MGSIKLAFAVGSVLLVSAQLVFAGEFVQASQPKRRSSPYSQLFQPPTIKTPSTDAVAPPEKGRPRVVCGMTLIPIDPDMDPKIRVDRGRSETRYTIRAIPPPVCK